MDFIFYFKKCRNLSKIKIKTTQELHKNYTRKFEKEVVAKFATVQKLVLEIPVKVIQHYSRLFIEILTG